MRPHRSIRSKSPPQPLVDQPHPVLRQRLHLGGGGGHAAVHQLLNLGHQWHPLGAQSVPVANDQLDLIDAEVVFIGRHQCQRIQPIAHVGLAAAGQAIHQQGQSVSQRMGLGDLMFQRAHLPSHDHGQWLTIACQHVGDFLQRQPQLAQGLDAVQPSHIVAAIQPIARLGPRGRFEKADLVEVMKRAHGQARASGEFAHLELHRLQPPVEACSIGRSHQRGESAHVRLGRWRLVAAGAWSAVP